MTDTTSTPAVPLLPALRIQRSWRWIPVPGVELRIGGGPGPMHLKAIDVLEALVDGEWVAVPVVEAPKPEHPAVAAERQRAERMQAERMQAEMAEVFKNIKVLKPGEPVGG